MTENELLRNTYSSLAGEDAPPGENENYLVRRILYALVEGGAGISRMMSTNEAWRRIVGAYEGSEIAEGMTNNMAMRRSLIALGVELPYLATQNQLLVLFAENAAPSDPTAVNWTRDDITWETDIDWETTTHP